MTTPRAIFITHRAKPGRRDDVHGVWKEHLEPAIRENRDHLAYHYNFDATDADVIRVFQLYTSSDAAAAFLTTAAYASYLESVDPLLSGPPDVVIADHVWTKGD
jgi:quinol monooxygenase YgiN